MEEQKEHWTVHLGFKTTEEYVDYMAKNGSWGSEEYQKKFMEKKAKKKQS